MNEIALEERLGRLEKELGHAGNQTDQRLLDMRADLDRLRLEVKAIIKFLGQAFPAFEEQFPQIMSRTIQEVNPEFD